MSICENLVGDSDRQLCMALEAAQNAEAAAKVPSKLEVYGKWLELSASGLGIALAIIGLLALIFVLIKFRKLPEKISNTSFKSIGVTAGPVEVTLEQFQEAAKNTQSVAASLTEEVLELTDFVDRLLIGGLYDQGEKFSPPSCEMSKLALLKVLQARSGIDTGKESLGLLHDGMSSFGLENAETLEDLAYTDALPCHPLAGNAAHNRAEKGLKILWVDDRDELVAFERAMIKRQGHGVCAMRDTDKAVNRIEDQDFDLIITDTERGDDQIAWSALYDAARRTDTNAGREAGERTPFVVFTTFDKAEKINRIIGSDTEAFATHSFAQMRWRMRWLERHISA